MDCDCKSTAGCERCNPAGVYDAMRLYQQFQQNFTPDCQSCRSQIKAETRQKCWEDYVNFCRIYDVERFPFMDDELKKKWRIVK